MSLPMNGRLRTFVIKHLRKMAIFGHRTRLASGSLGEAPTCWCVLVTSSPDKLEEVSEQALLKCEMSPRCKKDASVLASRAFRLNILSDVRTGIILFTRRGSAPSHRQADGRSAFGRSASSAPRSDWLGKDLQRRQRHSQSEQAHP